MIIKKAIYDNEMLFEPILDEQNPEDSLCDETWRVINASCWIEFVNPLGEQFGEIPSYSKSYQPCDSVECCSIGLRVCRYKGPPQYIKIDTLSSEPGGSNCSTYSQIVFDPLGFAYPIFNPTNGTITYDLTDTIPCQNRCNWLHSISDEHFEGIISKESIKNTEEKLVVGEGDIYFKVIENDEYLDCFIFNSKSINNCNISVYNLMGQKLVIRNANLSKGINNIKINTSNYKSGIYLIQLEAEGSLFRSKKVIIFK